jgi:hypothetical protein
MKKLELELKGLSTKNRFLKGGQLWERADSMKQFLLKSIPIFREAPEEPEGLMPRSWKFE